MLIEVIDGDSLGSINKPAEWYKIYWEGRRVLQRLMELETPIVAAINGPATVHSEDALLADIVVASEDAIFMGKPPPGINIGPGAGIQVLYGELVRANRARYVGLNHPPLTARGASPLVGCDKAMASIGNTGPGVPPEQVHRLFDPFAATRPHARRRLPRLHHLGRLSGFHLSS